MSVLYISGEYGLPFLSLCICDKIKLPLVTCFHIKCCFWRLVFLPSVHPTPSCLSPCVFVLIFMFSCLLFGLTLSLSPVSRQWFYPMVGDIMLFYHRVEPRTGCWEVSASVSLFILLLPCSPQGVSGPGALGSCAAGGGPHSLSYSVNLSVTLFGVWSLTVLRLSSVLIKFLSIHH